LLQARPSNRKLPAPAARTELLAHAAPAPPAEPTVRVEQAPIGVFTVTADGRVDFAVMKTARWHRLQEFGCTSSA
jgi:hypothetical protein